MAKTFGAAERRIAAFFRAGEAFVLNGDRHTVVMAGKPTCSKGEPKTDIYVLARSQQGNAVELKISYKKSNADFLENKTTAERAEHFLGPNWKNIITKAALNLKKKFESRPLVYKTAYRKTEAGSITLGWKFELLLVKSGELSDDMLLNKDQVKDVYAGTSLTGDKRDATVNGKTIPESGVANYLLFEDHKFVSLQDVVNSLVSIDEYVERHPKIYFACKALNYRTMAHKYDGNRPLAVYVDWKVKNGKLSGELKFDTPLSQGGDEVYSKLVYALQQLNVHNTDDLNTGNVENVECIH